MIDNNTVEQVRNADIITFLEKYHGFTFNHRGGAYRCSQHPSLAVKSDRRSFYWHSRALGGHGVLDYLTKAENMPFREAVRAVAGMGMAQLHANNPSLNRLPEPSAAKAQQCAEKPKALILPERTGIPIRLYDYLCVKRGIDSSIVNSLIQKGMVYEDKRKNVVFVGFDEHGKARYASLRGAYGSYRGECPGSDKRYGFCTAADAPSKRLYLFESAIDLLSHATLANLEFGDGTAWEYDSRLSLAGVSDSSMPFFLNQHKDVKELIFCLDNDAAGHEATKALSRKYTDKGYAVTVQQPTLKDFNEELVAFRQREIAQIHHPICPER